MSAVDSPSKGEVEALDPEYVSRTLSSPPFVPIAGVHNVRDIGSLPITSDTALVTRPRYAYRAAEISAIQDGGAWLPVSDKPRPPFDARFQARRNCES